MKNFRISKGWTKAILVVLLSASFLVSTAQVTTPTGTQSGVTESQAGSPTQDSGVTQEQIKAHLKSKGIDLDNLRPEQMATVEADIQQAILELQGQAQAVVDPMQSQGVQEVKATETPKPKEVGEEPSDEELEKRRAESQRKQQLEATRHIYGFELFYNKSIEFYDKVQSGKVPDNYVLDAGDKIAVNIFGQSQADLLYEIEEDGFIRPTGMYKIYLKGVTVLQAKSLLRTRFAQRYVFENDQFNVSLNSGRTIKVNIFGEVNEPGSFTISAYNNLFNAIVGAGGPKSTANLRNIRVVSGGKERTIDVYEYITDPSSSKNLGIKEGDIIFIDRTDRRVQLKGKPIQREATVYDLKANENLKALLDIAQIRPDIKISNVQVESLNDDQRAVQDFAMNDVMSNDVKLKHGDVILVSGYSIEARNFYSIQGSVLRPGRYELTKGMMLSDAIDMAGFDEDTWSDIAYLKRVKPDGNFMVTRLDVRALLDGNESADLELQSRDEIRFMSTRSFVDSYEVTISGAVREPGKFEVSKKVGFTIYDVIALSKGLTESATDFGYIVSTDITNPTETSYRIVDIRSAYQNPYGAANITLAPNDRLMIPDRKLYSDQFEISIDGAVRKPGQFKYDAALTLKQVILMAGGLKFEAASNRIDVYRLQVTENEPTVTLAESVTIDRNYEPLNMGADFELRPFDQIIVRNAPEFEPIRIVTIKGEVRYPGKYAIIDDNERISDIVARADGITSEAFTEAGTISRSANGISGMVVTRIDKALKERKRHNLVVKPGDVITIPKSIDVVGIDRVGTKLVTEAELRGNKIDTTNNQINVQVNFKPRRAKWYIKNYAGGFSKEARRSATSVLYPNGQVKSTLNLGIVKIYPKVRRGSHIYLELKEVKETEFDAQRQERIAARKERLDRLVETTTTLLTLTTTAITTVILVQKL